MQAYIHEIRGDFVELRPPAAGVGDHERHVVATQQPDEFRIDEARVPNLDGVAQWTARTIVNCGAACHARIVPARKRRCADRVLGQAAKEVVEQRGVEAGRRGKLPQEWPELVAQVGDARGEEVRQRGFRVAQAQDVRHVARAFDAEHEVVGRLAPPLRVVLTAAAANRTTR